MNLPCQRWSRRAGLIWSKIQSNRARVITVSPAPLGVVVVVAAPVGVGPVGVDPVGGIVLGVGTTVAPPLQ
jgi:hypothetical protein